MLCVLAGMDLISSIKVKVKVKFSLEQATNVQRGAEV
jgi:hypothetical protein